MNQGKAATRKKKGAWLAGREQAINNELRQSATDFRHNSFSSISLSSDCYRLIFFFFFLCRVVSVMPCDRLLLLSLLTSHFFYPHTLATSLATFNNNNNYNNTRLMSDLHCDGINDTAMVTATNTPSSSLPSSPSPSSSTPQHPHPAKKRLLSFPHPTTPDTNYNSDNSNNLCTNIILTNTPTNTMANSNHANTISDLPIELAFLILAYLPYRSLVSLSLVDRYWRHLTFHNDSILWYNLASKHGFLPRSPLLSPPLPSEPSSSSTPTSTLTTISTTLTASLRRWSLVDALAKRPGLNRALSQSRNRLLPIDPSSTSSSNSPSNRNTIATTLRPSSPLSTQKTSITTKTAPKAAAQTLCARLERGEVATWRDYFEASLILRREWINGKPVTKELRGHDAAVICVKVLPGRDRVVTGDRLGFLKVWCAVTGVCLKTYKRHMMGISSLSIQGDLLVSGSWVSQVVIGHAFIFK